MRASLVGVSTAMMTPLFPVIGLNYLVFRHLPSNPSNIRRTSVEVRSGSFPSQQEFEACSHQIHLDRKIPGRIYSTNFESATTLLLAWNGLEIFSLWSGILALSHFSLSRNVAGSLAVSSFSEKEILNFFSHKQ